jgi:hypothetical protein
MYREFYEGFMIYFWILTDWGLLWLSVVFTGLVMKLTE